MVIIVIIIDAIGPGPRSGSNHHRNLRLGENPRASADRSPSSI